MRRNIIVFIIICLIILPFIIGIIEPRPLNYDYDINTSKNGNAMPAGSSSGNGNGTSLEEAQTSSTDNYSEWIKDATTDWTQYQTLIFIACTEPDGEYMGMTTTAIMCCPQLITDGVYKWTGTSKSWTDYNTLHYKVIATGDQNGFSEITATEYIWGEETNNPVYIREIIGV